jgi:hypothetical protein
MRQLAHRPHQGLDIHSQDAVVVAGSQDTVASGHRDGRYPAKGLPDALADLLSRVHDAMIAWQVGQAVDPEILQGGAAVDLGDRAAAQSSHWPSRTRPPAA